jgi:cytochrome c-type biogenesis protein CcmE
MKLSLLVCRNDNVEDYSVSKRFRFAVVDLDKGKDYPVNFVCMLPMQPNSSGKGLSVFVGIFGDKSLIVAKELLLEALEVETASEVKREIERRLKLLGSKPVNQVKCDVCGQLFQAQPRKRFKQKFCPECLRKKFGSRA